MKLLAIMILLGSLVECGKRDYGPLAPEARSFGIGCEMGDAAFIESQCGSPPNSCGGTINGSINNVGKESQSSSVFCNRWCVDGCPSGTFCPNPDHGKEGLFLGFCYRACEHDSNCGNNSVCDFKMGEGACIPSCNTPYTVCDAFGNSKCLANGHCSN